MLHEVTKNFIGISLIKAFGTKIKKDIACYNMFRRRREKIEKLFAELWENTENTRVAFKVGDLFELIESEKKVIVVINRLSNFAILQLFKISGY